jgi:hypothetical protein
MKLGIVLFHSNIFNLYRKEWIEKCIHSLNNQTSKNFQFYEINYGSDDVRLINNSKFFSIEKVNYADAMNFIISEAFNDGCDYVFNSNLDDFYSEKRIEKQLEFLKNGYDIVSSDFCYIDDRNNIIKYMNILQYGNIIDNLNHNHNVIAHPSVAISKNFWMDPENRYDIKKVPSEDLDLWKRSIGKGYKFHIVNDILLFYRIHNNQVSIKL